MFANIKTLKYQKKKWTNNLKRGIFIETSWDQIPLNYRLIP